MSNLAIALALILAGETPDFDHQAVGDKHLPIERRAYGRMQIRHTVLKDLNSWSGLRFNREDSQSEMDVQMAAWWLRRKCGTRASVRTYLMTWNAGVVGVERGQGRPYVKRIVMNRKHKPDHYRTAMEIVRRYQI